MSREVTQTMIPSQNEETRQEVTTNRPKIVSVVCRPHEGQKSAAPYSIKPAQLVRMNVFVSLQGPSESFIAEKQNTVFNLITAYTPISAQSSSSILFRL